MELIIRVFALENHLLHVGLKVWETRPAVWLTQQQMPHNDHARSRTGHGGNFMMFDIDTIDIWLTFLSNNMHARFGDQIHRQIQGTPMGTNCASHLANLYLMMYELRFYVRLATLCVNPAFTFLRTMLCTIARAPHCRTSS